MPRARKDERLDSRQPFEQQLVTLLEARVAQLTDDGERRLLYTSRLGRSEAPLPQLGQLVVEERIGVCQCLIEGTGNRAFQNGAVPWTARPSEERFDRSGGLAGAVELDGLRDLGRAWHRQERRLEERDGVYDVGNVQCDLKSDAAAGGVADDVCSIDAEMAHESAEGGRLPCERERTCSWARVRVPGAVIEKQPMAIGECGRVHQRSEPISAGTVVDERDAFPRAANLVLELDASEGSSSHASLGSPPPPEVYHARRER